MEAWLLTGGSAALSDSAAALGPDASELSRGAAALSRGATFPRVPFALTVMLLFFFYCLLEHTFSLVARRKAASFFPLLPAALLFLLLQKTDAPLFWSAAVASAAAARLFFILVPHREKVLLYGVFAPDAAAAYLYFGGHVLRGAYATDKLLFVALAVLTLASLQELLFESPLLRSSGTAFPFFYFALLGILVAVLPMRQAPINWTPVAEAGGRVLHRVMDIADSAAYYLSSKWSGSYTTGYHSLEVTGGKIERSDRTELILRTGQEPYHMYTDEETSGDMKMRRTLYLAGGMGVDKPQLIRFLRFLRAGGADREYAAIETELLERRSDLASCRQELVRLDAEQRACENERQTTKDTVESAASEIRECLHRIEGFKSSREQARARLTELNIKIAEAEKNVNTVTGSRAELTKQREELTAELQNIRLEIVTAQKDIDALNAEIVYAQNSGTDIDARKAELNAQIDGFQKAIAEKRAEIAENNRLIENKKNTQNAHSRQIEALSEQRSLLEKRSVEIRAAERTKTSERENSGRELARLEERKINLQKEYDTIIAKLWEEYELTRREAEKIAITIEEPAKAQKRLNSLKQSIKALGTVNVSSIEEYKEVSERYEFLSVQVKDVEKSKSEIERLITSLTKQMKEVFVESFEQINRNFTYTFKELFGGGTASLSLADPENILTSGIDIVVHPPGKIVVHLDALSGGEKALVAIALYFAIMKVRPAPFCVMDEIEAALDDVNVNRFASYLRRLTDKTQFILITHRRGTMEEADVLYGVTMQDEGISKLLELRSTEVAEKLGIKSN